MSNYLIMDYRDAKEPLARVIDSLVQQHMEAALRADCLGAMLGDARMKQAQCEMREAGLKEGDRVLVAFTDGEEVCELVRLAKTYDKTDVELHVRHKTQKGKWCKTVDTYDPGLLKHMKKAALEGASR